MPASVQSATKVSEVARLIRCDGSLEFSVLSLDVLCMLVVDFCFCSDDDCCMLNTIAAYAAYETLRRQYIIDGVFYNNMFITIRNNWGWRAYKEYERRLAMHEGLKGAA